MWSREELRFCVKYPYSSKTKEIVKWLNFDIEHIDQNVLDRAMQRAKEAIQTGFVEPQVDAVSPKILLIEILSYPVAKIIVSSTRDNYIIKRYSHAESNTARRFLYQEKDEVLDTIALDIGIPIENNAVHFTYYLNHIPLHEQFKLVNSQLEKGAVYLSKEAKVELIAEVIKHTIENTLLKKYSVPVLYENYAAELKRDIKTKEITIQEEELGPVDSSLFPPCIKSLLHRAVSGENMPHQPRFVLATFLTTINMPTDQIVQIFSKTPNFNEKKTRYYVEYSAGKRGSGVKYTPPGCEKMKFYGLCINPDTLCSNIKHPLSYYKLKKRGRKHAKH